jgi:hypothetical protein
MEITGYQTADGAWISAQHVTSDTEGKNIVKKSAEPVSAVRVQVEAATKVGENFVLAAQPDIYLRELQVQLKEERGEDACLMTICIACRELGQSRKKRR